MDGPIVRGWPTVACGIHPAILISRCAPIWWPIFDLLRNPVHRRGWRRGRHLLAIQRLLFAVYADSGRPLKIQTDAADWVSAVVDQFTRSGVLWVCRTDGRRPAVSLPTPICWLPPEMTPRRTILRWSARGDDDNLRLMLARLTVDADGRTANTPGSDAGGSASGDTTPPTTLSYLP